MFLTVLVSQLLSACDTQPKEPEWLEHTAPLNEEGFPSEASATDEEAYLLLDPASLATAGDAGTIELEHNVLQGTARLTNRNPEILALLAEDPWHDRAIVSATSTKPAGFTASTTSVQFKSPSEYSFSMLVEAGAGGDAGVVYTLRGSRGAQTLGASYDFPPVAGSVVRHREQQPGPTDVTLTSCIGVVHFEFGTDETCQTPSPAFLSASVSGSFDTYRLGTQPRYTGYVTGGTNWSQILYYFVRGKDGRQYVFSKPVNWTAGCDEVVRICTPIPDDIIQPPLGHLTGPWELTGETLSHTRTLYANYLPEPLSRSFSSAVPTSPVSEPATWWKMSSMEAGEWSLYGLGYLRKGREFTRFVTPRTVQATVLGAQTTSPTLEVEGETRHAFAMRPAYFYGAVRLADPFIPLNPGSRSTLESLFFEADHDSNGDGIPNQVILGTSGSFLYARSAVPAHEGDSRTAFPGHFDRTRGELASTYEQVLPNPYNLPHNWTQRNLVLRFWSEGVNPNTRPGMYDEANFRYGTLNLGQENTYQSAINVSLDAGQWNKIDHEYCFNEVQLQYTTASGRFYNPQVRVGGSFKGKDWRALPSHYAVAGTLYGTPAFVGYEPSLEELGQEGSVSLALPQGTYTLTPAATMVSDDGTENVATFAPISVTLGCGQRVKLVPPLSVSISSASGCATGPSIPISGVVKSKPAVVDRIWYRLNGGPEVPVCTNCGIDPAYSFTLPLQACNNTLQVFAQSEGMREPATGTAEFVWDDPADGPSCPNTYCVNRRPVARCRSVTVAADSACRGCASVDDGSYDPDGDETFSCVQTPECPHALGSRKVTLTCTDDLGLSSSCEATVTVTDVTPPALVCPDETPVLECRDGGAVATYVTRATDNCGGVTTACAPASGSTFPRGTTLASCSATDSAGNRASCDLPITVQDTQPPTLTLNGPDTVTLGCGTGASYTEQGATASDVCLGDLTAQVRISGTVDVSVPGSYTLTYTVADLAGNTATTTRTVHVGAAPSTCSATPANWAPTGRLASPRLQHTTTPLPSGKVLVVGGFSWSTELYDPGTGTWETTGSTFATHRDHTATLLPDGRVLVAGGDGSEPGDFAEVYDATTGLWQPAGALGTARRFHTATLLPDGRVLVTGGSDDTGAVQASAELYEPATGSWQPAAGMATARSHHTATLLRSGQVLITGGNDGNGTFLSSSELYDPATGSWRSTGGMTTARRFHAAALLPSGEVLVTGGGGTLALSNTAELYNPATATWTATGGLGTARRYHTATVLKDGRVLVVGGYNERDGILTSAELYNACGNGWCPAGSMAVDRYAHTATLLTNGRVLLTAGVSNRDQSSAELYIP
ncbi:kelch repeat-containing protein [Archangium gephyra]|uniref:kelch repeat-containing protein n=1 Tax=Archangium gephyra TaxID=48 RepID=UPI0014771774|nr:kelch repeat-containing protein [Archangium gephyra]